MNLPSSSQASASVSPSLTSAQTPLIKQAQAYQNIADNPSWRIASRLPPALPGVHLVVHPEPLRSAYHTLLDLVPRLIREHRPDVALHIGRAAEQAYFSVERSAPRDGYHQFPDVDRRVFTKAETRECWGKGQAALATSLDLDAVLEAWRRELLAACGGGKNGKGAVPEVRVSDDVGTYVCGFAYYASLAEMAKGGDGRRAVFLHVPALETEADIEKGKDVVLALIKALAET